SGPKLATTDGSAMPPLSIDDFALDERTGRVDACPTGRIPLEVCQDVDAETGTTTTTIHMSPAACEACPFQEQCPVEPGRKTYTTSYTDKERRLEARRGEEKTEIFQERYNRRSGIESTHSGTKRRLGLGRLRVRGRKAVFHTLYLKAA